MVDMAGKEPAAREALIAPHLQGPAFLVLAIAGALAFFYDGIQALLVAWQLPEYSHGPLIPILSGFLMLRQMKSVPADPGPVSDRWPGVYVMGLAVALALVGKLANIADVVAYALILWVGGVILTSFGWKRGRQFWPPVLHLCFMLPLPGLFYYKVSIALQFIASELGVWLLQVGGVPVYLDGNIIDLGVYKLHVAEACSGLRYLFPILSFSYIFAVLFQGPMWHKAVLLISAAPIAVVMNSVRIAIVGVMVNHFGIDHAEGLSHFLEGWVIFITCVLIMFGLAWALLQLQRRQASLVEAMDLDLSGLGEQLARVKLIRPSQALAAGAYGITAAALIWIALPERSVPALERAQLVMFPGTVGEWTGGLQERLGPGVEQVLAADDYLSVQYNHPEAEAPVDLFIAWYGDQTKGGIHSPEVCLPGSGWEMAEMEVVDIAPQIGTALPFPVNRVVIQKGPAKMLVYYWFDQAGTRIASDYTAKAMLLWSGLTTGRSDGALMRLITPLRRGETAAAAEARLQSFLKPALDELPRFVPGA